MISFLLQGCELRRQRKAFASVRCPPCSTLCTSSSSEASWLLSWRFLSSLSSLKPPHSLSQSLEYLRWDITAIHELSLEREKIPDIFLAIRTDVKSYPCLGLLLKHLESLSFKRPPSLVPILLLLIHSSFLNADKLFYFIYIYVFQALLVSFWLQLN